MEINSINGINTQMRQMGMNQATDSYSRNLQNQIADAQKQGKFPHKNLRKAGQHGND